MYHVVSATTNPAKIKAIVQGFDQIFGAGSCYVEPVVVESGVPEQPLGDAQTRAGARNRVENARRAHPDADFWVAIEAGIDEDSTFSWIVIQDGEKRSQSRSATLPLPPAVLAKIHAGETLGPVMSALTGIDEMGRKEGAIGLLTSGALSRSSVYLQAVILALSPFHHALYD